MKTLTLNTGAAIPILGFGTWELTGEQCLTSVRTALEVGYRHIDTAAAYGNHEEVGKAIAESGVKREDIFLTSKIWRDSLHREAVPAACEQALAELQTDYLDLYLIHWPNSNVPVRETLEAMNKLREQGLVRAIGVSNFTIRHLEEALQTDIQFSVNQVEFHPTLSQNKLKEFCDTNDIILTAYSPIGRGEDLQLPLIQELAEKYQRSPAQVILNWEVRQNIVTIPKSGTPEHITDNFKTLEWELAQEDAAKISDLPQQERIVNPDFAEFE